MVKKIKEFVKIGVIGGSGVYEIEGIKDIRKYRITTPFGKPSGEIVVGTIENTRIAFLPRHGKGHIYMPTEVNFRANIYAMKMLGIEQIVSLSACGSLKEELKPRDFVIPLQLFDRTWHRPTTFFGKGIVAHVPFANPYCLRLSKELYEKIKNLKLGIDIHYGGTYVCIEGPQFSTKAESEVHRQLGFSIIGMTNLPEAKLAREAEICYVTIALVTDYDVWKAGEEVSVAQVMGNFKANIENVKKVIKNIIPTLEVGKRECECANALKYAIQTQKKYMNKRTYQKLILLLQKYIKNLN